MISNLIFMCTTFRSVPMKPMNGVADVEETYRSRGCIESGVNRKCSSNKYDEKSLETRHQLLRRQKIGRNLDRLMTLFPELKSDIL